MIELILLLPLSLGHPVLVPEAVLAPEAVLVPGAAGLPTFVGAQASLLESSWAMAPPNPLSECRAWASAVVQMKEQPKWKRDAAAWILKHEPRWSGYCRRTNYCPHCDHSGVFADGASFYKNGHLRIGVCAADPSIPMHSVLWIPPSRPQYAGNNGGLLFVRDRGGAVRRRYCRGRARHVIDVFQARCVPNCNSGTDNDCPLVILGPAGEITGGAMP